VIPLGVEVFLPEREYRSTDLVFVSLPVHELAWFSRLARIAFLFTMLADLLPFSRTCHTVSGLQDQERITVADRDGRSQPSRKLHATTG
jgi:hypothetical protein